MGRILGVFRHFFLLIFMMMAFTLAACVQGGPENLDQDFDSAKDQSVQFSDIKGAQQKAENQGSEVTEGEAVVRVDRESIPPYSKLKEGAVKVEGTTDEMKSVEELEGMDAVEELAEPSMGQATSPMIRKLEFMFGIDDVCEFNYSDDKCDKPSWLEGWCNDYELLKRHSLALTYYALNVVGVPEFDENCKKYFTFIQTEDGKFVQADPPESEYYIDQVPNGYGRIQFNKPTKLADAANVPSLEPIYCTFQVRGDHGQCKQFGVELGYCVVQGYGDCGGVTGCTNEFTRGIRVKADYYQWDQPCD